MSFGTIVQPNILLTKHAKLGLTQRSGDQRREGIGKPRSRGFEACSQSYSQLVTRSLPSIKLLLVDSSDHPPPPLDRWVAEEGVKGAFVTAKELFPYKSQEVINNTQLGTARASERSLTLGAVEVTVPNKDRWAQDARTVDRELRGPSSRRGVMLANAWVGRPRTLNN